MVSVCVGCSVVSNSLQPHGRQPTRLLYFPGSNTRVGCHPLLQGIVLTQVLNPGLLHCRQILYHLRHHGSMSNSLQATKESDMKQSKQPPGRKDSPIINPLRDYLVFSSSVIEEHIIPLQEFQCLLFHIFQHIAFP